MMIKKQKYFVIQLYYLLGFSNNARFTSFTFLKECANAAQNGVGRFI